MSKTRHQKGFAAAAKACKAQWRTKGSVKQRRSKFNACIKAKLRK